MSIALIGNDDCFVGDARALLAEEGAPDVFAVQLNDLLDGRADAAGADLLILLTREQGMDKVGGRVAKIRPEKRDSPRLVLCMPQPDARTTSLLLKHANEIIYPAGFGVEHFVERVLGLLILEKRIEPYDCGQMLGATKRMRELYGDIKRYAERKDKEKVLILGETGTGKKLVAEALHQQRFGKGKPVHIDLSAISSNVIEPELFGTVKGAFTEAINRAGLLEEANGGTAFMDEIGELRLDTQQKLLSVLEEKHVRRVGTSVPRLLDVWFVFATNRNLREEVERGSFRRDLLGRVNRLVLELPPLRQRKADIPLIVEHFVNKYSEPNGTKLKTGPGAVDELFRLDWTENVRDLDNVVFRAAANVGADGIITDTLMRESLRLAGGHAGASGHAAASLPFRSVVFRPREDKWPAVRARAEAAYFRAITEVAKGEKEAFELSGMKKARFYAILRKHGLSLKA